MVFADFTFGHALLTVVEIFFFVIWVWLFITIVMDLFRDHELSGGWKALWCLFLIVVPFVSALVYLIFRGNGMRDRAIAQQREIQQATDAYIRDVAPSPADELTKLSELRDKGALSDEEFQRLKAKIVG
nr:SHOCT domain-containing protein [Conexibacter woesei]